METFDNAINDNRLVLVDFYATWCQPCQMQHPVLAELKAQLSDRLRILKINIDRGTVPGTVGAHTDAVQARATALAAVGLSVIARFTSYLRPISGAAVTIEQYAETICTPAVSV